MTTATQNTEPTAEDFILRGSMTGAHGQPDALLWALLPSGEVLFHDTARMVYGVCREIAEEPLVGPPCKGGEIAPWDCRAIVRQCYIESNDYGFHPLARLAEPEPTPEDDDGLTGEQRHLQGEQETEGMARAEAHREIESPDVEPLTEREELAMDVPEPARHPEEIGLSFALRLLTEYAALATGGASAPPSMEASLAAMAEDAQYRAQVVARCRELSEDSATLFAAAWRVALLG